VEQGALKLILEPIFEADFQPGSFGYRPKRSAHQAVRHVETAIMLHKWRVIDLDLRAFFDNVSHSILLAKVAARVNDPDVMHLLKLILRASGKKGVPQGGVISPVMSNLYLNEVDRMLERAKEVTRHGAYTDVEYVRYADDLAILVYGGKRAQWLLPAVYRRVREELAKLRVEINEEKSRIVNMSEGDTIGFLGFDFRYVRSRNGKWTSHTTPQRKKRTALLERLRREFDRFRSQPVEDVVAEINPILRGWVNYFAIGNSARCFSYVRNWVEVRICRHVQRARKQRGFGWKTWTRERLTRQFGLFTEYRVRHRGPSMGAAPA
jgi:RNA-directed DNA polymerase